MHTLRYYSYQLRQSVFMVHTEHNPTADTNRPPFIHSEWIASTQKPDSIFIMDPAGTLLEVNSTFASHFGKQPEEYQGVNIYELLASSGLNEHQLSRKKKAEEVLSTGKELTFQDIVNNTLHLRHTIYPIRCSAGTITHLLVIVQNITALKQLEQEKQELFSQWDYLSGKWNIGMVLFHFQNNKIYRTLVHDQLLGYGFLQPEWSYEKFLEHVVPEDRPRFDATYKRCIEKGSEYHDKYRIYRTDGEVRWIEAVGGTDLDDYGKPFRFMTFLHDITEQKMAEIAREEMEAQLRQSQKMELLGQLAGGIAHDFNNILAAILGNTELLLEQVDERHPFYARIDNIRQSATRSTNMVRQLLAFARKERPHPQLVDPGKELHTLRPMLRQMIGENIQFKWNLENRHSLVLIDPSQLVQIITNLCINSRDAITDTGTITITTETVHIRESGCQAKGTAGPFPGIYVRLSVSDTGCGIDKKALPHIFEPFFTTKEAGKGTGLGLSTVYGIVKQNNGFIDCQSEPGQGSIFSIYLPEHESHDKKAGCFDSSMEMPD